MRLGLPAEDSTRMFWQHGDTPSSNRNRNRYVYNRAYDGIADMTDATDGVLSQIVGDTFRPAHSWLQLVLDTDYSGGYGDRQLQLQVMHMYMCSHASAYCAPCSSATMQPYAYPILSDRMWPCCCVIT